jgi:hypothetical protein
MASIQRIVSSYAGERKGRPSESKTLPTTKRPTTWAAAIESAIREVMGGTGEDACVACES